MSKFDTLTLCCRDEGHQIAAYYELHQNAHEKIATNYQITTSDEYQLIGQSMPYDIRTLHSERQKFHNRIAELQAMIIKD